MLCAFEHGTRGTGLPALPPVPLARIAPARRHVDLPQPRRRVPLCRDPRFALALGAQRSADPVTRSTLGWAVNGIVSEVARAGDVAFVGGSFGTVAPSENQVFGVAAFAPIRRCRCCHPWT